ncbi:NUDIX hydrolase [Salsuginibacillus kocurii]|uniref:NUDIX hydrolase n=1 Tax=Salsuginibacillus kocurii TaxID=427078 RepID=UPI00036ED555|nr:NUDIX hydrolase [Salsuginibacillus kocurii]
MDLVFNTAAGVFNYRVAGIWIENEHVLLHKNIDDEHWALPGGRAELMEPSETTVQREFQEELGVEVRADRLLWTMEHFFTYKEKDFHEFGMYYLVTAAEHGLARKDSFWGVEGEPLLYKWFPLSTLEELTLYPTFLKKGLVNLPQQNEHVVVKKNMIY